MDYLQELLNNSYNRHSRYQVKNFIIALNGKTDYGMYKQCVREIMSRIENLKTEYKQLQELKNDSLEFQIKEHRLNDMLYETNIFWNYSCQLRNRLGELTAEKIEQLEKEFWKESFKEKMCFELLGTGHISPNLLETIIYSESKIELLTFLNNIDKRKAMDFLTQNSVNLELDNSIKKLTINDIDCINLKLSNIERKFLNG